MAYYSTGNSSLPIDADFSQSLPYCVWVPCIPDLSTHSFIPIYTISNFAQSQISSIPERKVPISRGGMKWKPWKESEDNLLIELVQKYGTKQWAKISLEVNNALHGSLTVRNGKQCRERWKNHLNPNLNKGEWSLEEDLLLMKQKLEVGKKWCSIAKRMPGRTENSVKNRWNSLIKAAKKIKELDNTADDLIAAILIEEFTDSLNKH
ncbi:MYBL2_1 [Blepharisma stoltei]|uniref:Uncharacterized protein n=1 Tax=Blepharisma stoltei TaxID=1481888 RepID=A0AAU9IMX9_9CILI|nr:unnamed protein product [Blepharisma stoltei]